MQTTTPDLIDACEMFAENDTLAFIWVDAELTVRDTFGALAAFVPRNQALTDSVPALFGFEDDLSALVSDVGRTLEIPNITIVTGAERMPRINLSVRWSDARRQFLILVARALSRAALEQELQTQVRNRRLMEMMLLEQAEAIRETNRTLADVNRDLAEFAHVVSHDLKAPMRALRYFADDLESSLSDPDAGDPREHLSRLKAQSRRMTSMLSSLLSYARLERKDEALEDVNTGELVGDIVQSLPVPPRLTVKVSGTWPVIATIPALIDLVLRNLVENAIRFAPQDGGIVEISAEVRASTVAIAVKDDGPGISLDYQTAIFRPFTQLPDETGAIPIDENSSGMGLALVKRAVEAAGAEITVVSDPTVGPGTVFTVVWPL
ncbi:MAG: HAMP domain-containing sensor histidine kinase [Pseudomonadota bacterium]